MLTLQLMTKRTIFSLLPVALTVAALPVLSGCRREQAPRNLLYECAAYRVTADSVVTPLMGVSAADIPVPADSSSQAVRIDFGGSPLLSRLCAIGVSRLRARDSVESTPQGLVSLWLGGALMDSARVSAALRSMLGPDSLPAFAADGYQWPMGGGRELWTLAAYEDYCLSGGGEWLRKICRTQRMIMKADSAVTYRADIGLMNGGLCMADVDPRGIYPRWVNATGRFESISLAVNSIAVAARRRLGNMLTELGENGDAVQMEQDKIASAVNDRLWVPAGSHYSAYLYGGFYPLQAPVIDNFGQALAMLAGIPTAEMRSAMLASTPMVYGGPSTIFPSPAGTLPYNGSETWPVTQALWAIAAAEAGDGAAMAFAVASLMRAAALEVDGGLAAEMLAVVTLRAMAGVKVTSRWLELHPVVLTPLEGSLTIGPLRYRNAQLTINISGSGSTIAAFAIDGVATSSYKIDASLTGRHTVDVVLANNIIPLEPLAPVAQAWLPLVPEVEWVSRNSGRVVDVLPGATYSLWYDGVLDQILPQPAVSLDSIDRAAAVSISASQRGLDGFVSEPHFAMPRGAMTILEVENFESGGTARVRRPRISLKFVESSRSEHPVIELEITEPVATEALIDVCYANGNGPDTSGAACGIRQLIVNGLPCGSLVMPGRGNGWWATTAMSNTLKVSLKSGVNKIAVVADGIGSEPELLIDYLRIIRLHKFAQR